LRRAIKNRVETTLGGCLSKTTDGKCDDGQAVLVTAAEGMKLHASTAPANANSRRATVLEHLIETAAALNHPDDIAKWEADLANVRARPDSK
jgi:hypothetical protein